MGKICQQKGSTDLVLENILHKMYSLLTLSQLHTILVLARDSIRSMSKDTFESTGKKLLSFQQRQNCRREQ